VLLFKALTLFRLPVSLLNAESVSDLLLCIKLTTFRLKLGSAAADKRVFKRFTMPEAVLVVVAVLAIENEAAAVVEISW